MDRVLPPAGRMVHGAACLLLLAILLAGCSGDEPSGSAAAEEAARSLDLKATSSTGVIRGIVVDEAIRPVAGVAVALANGGNTTTTSEGAFGFDGLAPGLHFVAVSHPDYTPVQQSVDVVAGLADPPLLRVLVTLVPRATPAIEEWQTAVFLEQDWAITVPVVGQSVLSPFVYYDVHGVPPNATVAQAELIWESTTGYSERIFAGISGLDAGGDYIAYQNNAGTSPLVVRTNMTEDGDTPAQVEVYMYLSSDDDHPVEVAINQQIDIFVHVFYGFTPRDDWQFGRDGPYPLPSG